MRVFVFVGLLLVARQCCSRSMPEESVVSVYTGQPLAAGAGAGGRDVYQQIANNIAERITSPIYRFLGIERNRTDSQPITKKPWDKIELLDEPEMVTKSANPVDNDISEDRDVEELSVEALRKTDQKPEKITLYSSYLPVKVTGEAKSNLELVNNTVNSIDDDDPIEFDDLDKPSDDGPTLLFKILGGVLQFVQIAWSAIQGLFTGRASSS